MPPYDIVVFGGALFIVGFLTFFVGIWGNWRWVGPDGSALSYEQTPGLLEFWFSYIPKTIWQGLWRRSIPTPPATYAEAYQAMLERYRHRYGAEAVHLALGMIEWNQRHP